MTLSVSDLRIDPPWLLVCHLLHVLGIISEDSNVHHLLVKQSYPLKTDGEQTCESARKTAMEEVSRIITSDGTVIRTLLDGSSQVIVHCSDAVVYF